MVVGWYHSHPGFGCWLSGVDVNTQQSFEALNQRAVAVVIDPIQSVKGKVVVDAFRCISPQTMMLGQEPRQTTSNVGHLQKPSIQVSSRARRTVQAWRGMVTRRGRLDGPDAGVRGAGGNSQSDDAPLPRACSHHARTAAACLRTAAACLRTQHVVRTWA